MRKFVIIVILSVSSLAFAQDEYHDDEFGFTIDIPSQWYATSENEWSDEVKSDLKRSGSNPILLINPSRINSLKPPCISVHGIKLKRTTTSEAIANFRKNGKEILNKSTKYSAMIALGPKFKEYSKIDLFYHYDSSRCMALAKKLYQHNYDRSNYFMAAMAKFIGRQRRVEFDGYSEGQEPDQFWQVFTEVIDSFEFDADAKPKGILGTVPQEIKEVSKLSSREMFKRVWKWIGIILPVLIVLGFVKMALSRWFS